MVIDDRFVLVPVLRNTTSSFNKTGAFLSALSVPVLKWNATPVDMDSVWSHPQLSLTL